MGAHTAVRLALEDPERVTALVLITPAYDGSGEERWEGLADALEEGGIDGFLKAWDAGDLDERWSTAAIKSARQRLERHRRLDAVADALRVVPSSPPFDGLDELERIEVPTLVVGSRDEADPVHPLAVAEAYADRLPNGRLVVEDEGKSPLAWQGARLSKAIAEHLHDP
jgi:pimeloyl-ACP methyl ester carboxylesterase